MIFGYLLLALIPVAAIAYIIWDHKRKAAQREAASAGRLHELLGAPAQPVRSDRTEPAAVPASPARATSQPAPTSRTEPTAAAPLYAVRERLLTPPQTLAYYLLKTGLPDHLVFARVTLASVLDAGPGVPGYARNEQIRRLAGHTVDFVVSDKNMKPIVVLNLNSPERNGAVPGEVEPARTWLAMAGVRFIELDATMLPRKDGIRALVLGNSSASDGAKTAPQTAS